VDRLTQDALQIWQAGVDAVRADRVMRDSLRWDGRQLDIHDTRIDLSGAKRLIIVGAGKAAGGMLEGLLSVIRPDSIETQGWINVPEGSIPETLSKSENRDGKTLTVRGVRICEARPRGVNEPTSLVLDGTQEILKCVEQAGPQDAVIFLLSGGGSALLCAPHDWLSLQTKVAITRALSSRGAGIEELNAVRRALSRVKGGGLARRCSAGHLVTLVISDVLGDP
jgi:hydroxypyruvate reductase